jgi:hypothetical protein
MPRGLFSFFNTTDTYTMESWKRGLAIHKMSLYFQTVKQVAMTDVGDN